MLKLIYTIKKEDIGKNFIDKDKEEHIYLYNFMGRVLPLDVGKRIYKRKNNFCIENNEQLQKRLKMNN